MRLRHARIAPVAMDRLDPAQAEALAPFAAGSLGSLAIFRTLAHAPKALTAFLAWGSYILSKRNSLSERQREIAILRTGWNCRSGYEFAQHREIGLKCGLSPAEIEATKHDPASATWAPLERAIIAACDELGSDHFVSDTTWAALEPLGDKGRMDLVMTVGQYTQVSMMLNSFGVQLDAGLAPEPGLEPPA